MDTIKTADNGILRFSPDRGQRGRRTQSSGAAAGAAASALLVGGLGLRRMDLSAGLRIAGATVVVTVVAVILWRWLLPHAVSLAISRDAVTYRRFGRSTTIARSHSTQAVAALITRSNTMTAPYLCVRGDGSQFAMNLDLWSNDEQVQMVRAVGAADQTHTAATVAEFDEGFPDLLPGHVLHPHRFALSFIAIAVAAISAVTAVWQL